MRYALTVLCLAIFCVAAAAQQPEEVVPIVYANGLVGGVTKSGKWLTTQEVAPLLKAQTAFALVGLKGVGKTIIGTKGEEFGACPEVTAVNFEPENDSSLAIGINAQWNLVPRIPKTIALTDKNYVKTAADFLKTKGITKTTIKLTQALSVDLDGNGQNEILLAGNFYRRGMNEEQGAGDYSFVLLQRQVGGKLQNFLIEGEFFTKKGYYDPPNEREISAVADLDGDGKMEIVLYKYYYEGNWSTVYQFNQNKFVKVLEVDCGL